MKFFFIFLLLVPIAELYQFMSIEDTIAYMIRIKENMDEQFEGPSSCTNNEIRQLMDLKIRIFWSFVSTTTKYGIEVWNAMSPIWREGDTPQARPDYAIRLISASVGNAFNDYYLGVMQVYNGTAYAIYNTGTVCYNGTNPLVFTVSALNESYYKSSEE